MTAYKPDKACHGYTLFTPMPGTDAYLIDMKGRVVHRWAMPYRPAAYGYLLGNGNLLYAGRTDKGPLKGGGTGGIVIEVDWEGNTLWEYEEPSLHHDFYRMSNGNTMVLGWEVTPKSVARRVRGGRPGTEHESGIWSDYFREVTPTGQVAWEWHAYEHLDPKEDPICPLENREEWGHANTCRVLSDGNVLTSFRRLNTVAIIDKVSGDFAWKWGAEELGHQHDPNPLENGNILIFDNGWHSLQGTSPRSRVLEVDPKTNEIRWTYETRPGWEFFSSYISGAQRLPNGNTLVCEGMTGRLFEVTLLGDIVWEYINPFFGDDERLGRVNTVFRAYRYDPDFSGFVGKDLDSRDYGWMNHLYSPA